MVFDTGAAANLLSEKSAKAHNIDLSGSTQVQGAAGASNMKMTAPLNFTIGKTEVKSQPFVVMDISHLGEEDAPIDAVLGASILLQFMVEIDYDNQNLVLYERGNGPDLEGWQEVKVDLMPFRIPVIEGTIKLNDGKEYTGKYLVDTGAALTIMFNSNLVREENLIERLGEHYSMVSTSLSNSDVDQVSTIPSYTVFGHTFENFDTRLSQATQGVNAFPGYHGILGYYVLNRFNMVFDYANSRMFLKPNSHYNDPFPKSYSGLRVEKSQGQFKVLGVVEGSAAADAQIEKGDMVVSLDGKRFKTKSEFGQYFQHAEQAIEMILIRNGKEMNIKFQPRPTIN